MWNARSLLLFFGAMFVLFSLAAQGSGWTAFGFLLTASALLLEFRSNKATQERLAALERRLQEERARRLADSAEPRRTSETSEPQSPERAAAGRASAPVPPTAARQTENIDIRTTHTVRPSPLVVAATVKSTTAPPQHSATNKITEQSPADQPPSIRPDTAAVSTTANVVTPAPQKTQAQAAVPAEAAPLPTPAAVREPLAPATPAKQPPTTPPQSTVPVSVVAPPQPVAAKLPQAPAAAGPAAPVANSQKPALTPTQPPSSPAPTKPRRSLLDFEQMLGVNWLSKIGVAILVVGVSFFLAWQLRELGPLGKDIVGAVVGLALLGGGVWGERNERYRILARAVLAGGWSLLFFVAYATHHVAAARVIATPLGALVLMMATAAAMVAHTLRYRSQVVTGLAFALAFITVALNRADVASLSANVLLAVGFSIVVVRMRWFALEIIGIIATYANHAMWLRPIVEPMHGKVQHFAAFYASSAVLLLYWAIFLASYVVRRPPDEKTSAFAGMLNTALLLLVFKYQAARPDLAFWLLILLGVVELAVARLPLMRQKRTSFIVLTVVGAALAGAAIPFRFIPSYVTPAWLIDAILFTAVGIITGERVYRRLGTAVAAATTIQLLWFPVARLAGERFNGKGAVHDWPLATICVAVALVLYAESVWVPRRWPQLFATIDRVGARIAGFSGAFVAALAGWVAFPDSGAAVVWAAIALFLIGLRKRFTLSEPDLTIQAILVAVAAFARTLIVNLPSQGVLNAPLHLSSRLLTVAGIAVLFYLVSRVTTDDSDAAEHFCRFGGTFAGNALLVLLAWYELPARHVGSAWAILTLVLAFVARRFNAPHVSIQANAVAALALVRVFVVNLPSGEVASAQPLYVTWRLVAALLVSAALYLLARWNSEGTATAASGYFVLPMWSATTLLVTLQWFELEPVAVGIAWTLSAITLSIIGRRFSSFHLTLQANFVTAAAVLRVAAVNLASNELLLDGRVHLSWRLASVMLLVAALYFIARSNSTGALQENRGFQIAPLWTAAALMILLPWFELQPAMVVPAWTALGLAFALTGHRFRLSHLTAQANFVATAAVIKVVALDLDSGAALLNTPLHLTWRSVSVAALSSLLYLLAVLNVRGDFQARPSYKIVPRAIGTTLIMLLAWHELLPFAVGLAWSIAGFVLLLIGRRFRIADIAIQANAVALATIVASVTINLPSNAIAFADLSWRFLVVPLAAALLYALARWNSMDVFVSESNKTEVSRWQRFNEIDLATISTNIPLWAATALLSLLAWYQLVPASVAIAWTILALALLEVGMRRESRALRIQAYGLMFLVFGRVFVVNMNIDDAGTIGPRAYTIVPIVIAFLYVYARIEWQREEAQPPGWIAPAFAWMAIICSAALLRFELSADGVVIGWAALTVASVAAGSFIRKTVFVQIGIAVALATLVRGGIHNLYERSYFPSPGPFDRWIHIGVATLLLVAALPFAFRVRSLEPAPDQRPLRRLAHWLNARPEQILFFIPLLLLTALIGTEMRRGMLTVAWGIEAVVVFVAAVAVRERTYRLSGIGLLLLCVGKIFVLDFWSLNLRDKALTGIIMGLALIGVSLLYTRKREAILQFL